MELKDRCVSEISCEKADAEEQVFIQSLLFRVIELVESATNFCNKEYYLSSLCLQRSLIETIIITINFHNGLKVLIKEPHISTAEYNEFVNKYFHAQRMHELSEIAKKHGKSNTDATNINTRLTNVKKLGHDDLCELYNLLSEFIHNSFGILHCYSSKKNDSFILSQKQSGLADEANLYIKESYKHIKVFIKHFDDIKNIFLPKLLSLALRR